MHYHLQVPASDCAEVGLTSRAVRAIVTTTASRHYLRSAARGDLYKCWQQELSTLGPAVSLQVPPKLWNSLPPAL